MKLINWAQCPKGVITNYGELLLVDTFSRAVCFEIDEGLSVNNIGFIRIAPAEQQPWLVYEEGVAVVPEWAECEYRGVMPKMFGGGVFLNEVCLNKNHLIHTAHYKITGIKPSWTDKPNEVTK